MIQGPDSGRLPSMGSRGGEKIGRSGDLHNSGSNPILPSGVSLGDQDVAQEVHISVDIDEISDEPRKESEDDWEDVEDQHIQASSDMKEEEDIQVDIQLSFA